MKTSILGALVGAVLLTLGLFLGRHLEAHNWVTDLHCHGCHAHGGNTYRCSPGGVHVDIHGGPHVHVDPHHDHR